MSEPFLGEIRMFGFNFAPRGWALCDGQILPINQNQSLYSLLGTTYGGDGRTTFALPDLRGRSPMHMGSGFRQGQKAGEETHTLSNSEMPVHTHTVQASSADATGVLPTNAYLAKGTSGQSLYNRLDTGVVALNAAMVSPVGATLPHNNMQPYLTINFCIAMQGLFPPRG